MIKKNLPDQDILEKLGLTVQELKIIEVIYDDEASTDKKIERLLKEVPDNTRV